jgi:hypothetical protein
VFVPVEPCQEYKVMHTFTLRSQSRNAMRLQRFMLRRRPYVLNLYKMIESASKVKMISKLVSIFD